MTTNATVRALGALAHETRLEAFRLLVQRGPDGLPAGVIADRLEVVPSSLTFHLQQLAHAGLVTQRRVSRQLFYAANFRVMNELVAYLTDNCCGGETICGPICQPAKSGTKSHTRRRTA
jgi:ArsR family transcriptional regulator, arsenate/arsenite/antimonite-responsive transcriptional repressor